jgi:hypothetical protein
MENSASDCKAAKAEGEAKPEHKSNLFDFVGKYFTPQPRPENCIEPNDNYKLHLPLGLSLDTGALYRTCFHPDAVQNTSDQSCKKPQIPDYKKELDDYWANVDKAKAKGRAVLEFPPDYIAPRPLTPHKLPTVNEMLEQSRGLQRYAKGDGFQPDFKPLQLSEEEYKKAYAREVINVGRSANLDKDSMKEIVMNIYAFEGGGKATYDMLSGVPMNLTKPDEPNSTANEDKRRNIHPVSTAIGYNQIIMKTGLSLFEKDSDTVAARLRELGKDSPRKDELEEKAKLVEGLEATLHSELMTMGEKNRKKYLDNNGKPTYALLGDFAKSGELTSLGVTGRQLSSGIHALYLDGDIGPILQSRQLADVVSRTLSEKDRPLLEQKINSIKTEADAYDQLPEKDKARAVDEVLRRAHIGDGTVRASLKEKFSALPPGLSDTIEHKSLTEPEWNAVTNKILSLRKFGERGGAISHPGRELLDKIRYNGFGGPTTKDYLGAAVELGNLAGSEQAEKMLDPNKADLPTVNFFDRQGYEANPIVQRRKAGELVDAIFLTMHGQNADKSIWGNAQFEKAFDAQ